MIWLLALLAAPFALKVVWYLSLPYAMRDRTTGTVSLMPEIELFSLMLTFLASLATDLPWGLSSGGILLGGAGLLVGCFVHLLVAGWLLHRFRPASTLSLLSKRDRERAVKTHRHPTARHDDRCGK